MLCFLTLGVLVVAACGTPPQRFVDGYPIGEPACEQGCGPYLEVAFRWLDEVEPIRGDVQVTAFVPDYRTADGERIQFMRSGGTSYVFVFTLRGGRTRAVAVGCGGIGPVCRPEPPLRFDSSGRLVTQP